MTEFLWPARQLFLTPEALGRLDSKCRNAFLTASQKMAIEEDLTLLLSSLYLPLAAWLDRRRRVQSDALVVGLSGPQGSGKSTLASLLRTVLTVALELKVASFSLDDIYKTKAERQARSRNLHSLFATRGVPGTHDIDLGIETITSLKAQRSGQATVIPVFDKARDDRLPRSSWPTCAGELDLILFEGWCVGALPEPDEALATPINDLESDEDRDGAWRRAVNRALAEEYQKLFALVDVLLMLKVDGMDRVFEWRRLQERKLARKMAEDWPSHGQTRIMSDRQLKRFIMHYERLTRHMLAEMPARADLILFLESSHTPTRVLINKPIPADNSSVEKDKNLT
jgi:D-glycerate 3-kinase